LISKANLSRCVLHVFSHGQAAEEGVGEIKGKGVVDVEDHVYDRDVDDGEMRLRRNIRIDSGLNRGYVRDVAEVVEIKIRIRVQVNYRGTSTRRYCMANDGIRDKI
jgi:hypothetical protein